MLAMDGTTKDEAAGRSALLHGKEESLPSTSGESDTVMTKEEEKAAKLAALRARFIANRASSMGEASLSVGTLPQKAVNRFKGMKRPFTATSAVAGMKMEASHDVEEGGDTVNVKSESSEEQGAALEFGVNDFPTGARKCRYCGEIVTLFKRRKHILDTHFGIYKEAAPFKCSDCEHGFFYSVDSLNYHKQRCKLTGAKVIESQNNPKLLVDVDCPFCAEHFADAYLMHHHILKSHDAIACAFRMKGTNIKKPFNCSSCPEMTFASPYTIAKHWSTLKNKAACDGHLVVPSRDYYDDNMLNIDSSLPDGLYRGRIKSLLSAAVKPKKGPRSIQVNDEEKTEILKHLHRDMECPICEAQFPSLFGLARHAPAHGDDRFYFFKCDGCNMGFRTVFALKTHLLVQGKANNLRCRNTGTLEIIQDTRMIKDQDLKAKLDELVKRKQLRPPILPDEESLQSEIDERPARKRTCIPERLKEMYLPVTCTICKVRLRDMFRFSAHLRNHPGARNCHFFGCCKCLIGFLTAEELEKHLLQSKTGCRAMVASREEARALYSKRDEGPSAESADDDVTEENGTAVKEEPLDLVEFEQNMRSGGAERVEVRVALSRVKKEEGDE